MQSVIREIRIAIMDPILLAEIGSRDINNLFVNTIKKG